MRAFGLVHFEVCQPNSGTLLQNNANKSEMPGTCRPIKVLFEHAEAINPAAGALHTFFIIVYEWY